MSQDRSLPSVWRKKAKEEAIAKVSHELDIPRQGVNSILMLSKRYFRELLEQVDLEADLHGKPTRFEIPVVGGFYQIPRVYIIDNMYQYGHITKEQYESYMTPERIKVLNIYKNNYEQYKKRVLENKGIQPIQ